MHNNYSETLFTSQIVKSKGTHIQVKYIQTHNRDTRARVCMHLYIKKKRVWVRMQKLKERERKRGTNVQKRKW